MNLRNVSNRPLPLVYTFVVVAGAVVVVVELDDEEFEVVVSCDDTGWDTV